ncbi:MAG: hypothetical protein KatS3mg106_492 [Gemmataceae bacterium]|jgi:hypothetical protein|nr:MAG: hypothetical protein KatS3mg106_492 [Gemmataceae bacterium]GIW90418.1 MAG: hypothetical protein KatS3mg109_0850 [Pirellulaceae bacterium]
MSGRRMVRASGWRGWVVLAVLGMVMASGCNRFLGPREVRQLGRPDAPGYTIDEQQRRGRERLTVIEDDFRVGPKTYADRPSPIGR